jgi:hypothetical protein
LDPETPTEQELLEDMMAQMPCRLGYLRCEAGLVPPAMADQIRSILQLRGPFIELAQAGHHPMLDNHYRSSPRCGPCSRSGQSPELGLGNALLSRHRTEHDACGAI